MADIANERDIELLVNTFYEQVRKDDVIGFIFNTIIGEDWSKHLPIMYQFWGTILLNKLGYKGNVINKHIELDKKIPLNTEHYERWGSLWQTTVDCLYSGPKADEAKNRAALMLNLIQMKVDWSRLPNSIQ